MNVCISNILSETPIHFLHLRCPQCHQNILLRDRLPVLGYLILNGRCRYCRGAIPAQSLAMEILTGALFAFSTLHFYPNAVLVFMGAVLPSVFTALSIIDIKCRKIPNVFTLSCILTGIALSSFNPLLGGRISSRPVESFLGIAVAAALFSGVEIWSRLRQRQMMGAGDIKLLAGIGAFLGWQGAVGSLFIGSSFCLAAGLFLALKNGAWYGGRIPFGPFLSAGSVLIFYFPGCLRWMQSFF